MMAQSALRCSAADLSTVARGSLFFGFELPAFSAVDTALAGVVGLVDGDCDFAVFVGASRRKMLEVCKERYVPIRGCGSHVGRI